MPGSRNARRTLRPMGRPRHRGNGEGTTYHVPGRRRPWAASVTVGWTLEGRPIRRARYASSEREAKAMLLEMVAARETARPMPDDRMTVGKWLTSWLRSTSVTKLRPNTVNAYTYSVRLLLPELGNVPLRKLRSPQIEDALARIDVTGVRSVLSTAMKDAMRAGHVQTNEAALARSPKAPRGKLPAPDVQTVRAVLEELSTHRLSALFVLLAGTGLRIGEATGLRWEDVEDDRLTVAFQVQRIERENRKPGETKTEPILTDPKTDTAGRIVFLPPVLQAALRSHKARQAAERLHAGRKWRKADLVFTTTDGEPVAESTAQWVLSRACKRAGVRHVRPHDLRRFYLSTVQDAVGMDAAQLVAGHTNPKQTAGYITVRDGLLTRAAEAAQEAIG